jgi:hypothetical protein
MSMVNLSHGLEVHPDERGLYKKQFTENHSKINLDEFFKMCKELGLNSIVHDADSWKYLLNS